MERHPEVTFVALTTRSDWSRTFRATRRHVDPWAPNITVVFLMLCLIAGISFGVTSTVGPLGAAIGGLALVLLVITMMLNVRYSKRVHRRLEGELRMAFSPAEVTLSRTGQRTTFDWEAVMGWSEDAECFYVSLSTLVSWPLPKKGFDSDSEIERFRSLLLTRPESEMAHPAS